MPKLVSVVTQLRSIRGRHGYPYSCIFAMDEKACWRDMATDATIHKTGAQSVSLKTSGHEKDQYTVILTARADAVKLKPYMVLKGKGTLLMKMLQKIDGVIVRLVRMVRWMIPHNWLPAHRHRSTPLQKMTPSLGCLSLPHKWGYTSRNITSAYWHVYCSWRLHQVYSSGWCCLECILQGPDA